MLFTLLARVTPARAIRLGGWGALALAVLLVAGCSRTDPRQVPLPVASAEDYQAWRRTARSDFSPAEWDEFDAMVREIRTREAVRTGARGAAADAAAYRSLEGLTFHAVLVQGVQARRTRLQAEARELQDAIAANAWLVTKPDQAASARYLEGVRERQQRRLATLRGELERTAQRLVALGVPAETLAATRLPEQTPPPPVERDEALRQVRTMIADLRAAAQLKFGPWPMSLDREGARLPVEEREEYVAAKADATRRGEEYLAVRHRGKWWYYRGPAQAPALPDFVAVNLSSRDREQLRQEWCDLQAELWARRAAAEDATGDAAGAEVGK